MEPEDLALSALSLHSEHDIDVAISARAQLREQLDRELLNLRTHRNAYIPAISRLPNEILAEIIIVFVSIHRLYVQHEYLKWLWITHVCSRWRDTSLGIPSLWTVIITGRPLACVKAFVLRSKDLPLSVVSGQSDTRENLDPRFFAILIRVGVVDRLQNLELYLTRNTMMGLVDEWYLRPDYIHEPDSAPMLETLSLDYTTFEDDADPPDQFWFLTDNTTDMPKFRELTLVLLPPELTAKLVRPTLTKLSVDCPKWSMNVRPWLKILRKLPLIQTLELAGISVDERLPLSSTALARRMVTLRNLRELALWDGDFGDVMGCTQLLNHLMIPSDCIISLCADSETSRVALAVVASKKNGAGCLGPSQKFTSIGVSGNLVQLWAGGRPDCLTDFDRSYSRLPINRPMVKIRGVSIHDIDATTLPLPDLQLLCLRSTEPDHAFLSGLSGSLNLRELHYHRSLYMGDTLDVLARSNGNSPSTASPATPLPHIRSVILEATKWHLHPSTCPKQPFAGGPFSAVIDNFLSARREMNVPIDELHLPHVRLLNVPGDIEWLNRMSATDYPSTFSWSRWRGEDNCGPWACNLCVEDWPSLPDENNY